MNPRQMLLSLGLALYSVALLLAFTSTTLRFPLPFRPLFFLQGMMSPFSSVPITNMEVVAFGSDATGERRIDLAKYFPVSRGQMAYRLWFQTSRNAGPEVAEQHYADLANQIERKENVRDVHFMIETWPRSQLGYDALRGSGSLTPLQYEK